MLHATIGTGSSASAVAASPGANAIDGPAGAARPPATAVAASNPVDSNAPVRSSANRAVPACTKFE